MLKLLALVLGITVAHAQSYLVFPSQAACLARSQTMCTAMGCDGVHSKYWWDCSTPLNSGTVNAQAVGAGSYALRIDTGTMFDVTASNQVSGGVQGLTAGEQSNLFSKTVANASTVFPWIISTPSFKARFTTPQQAAMTASSDPVINAEWATRVNATAVINLQDKTVVAMALAAQTDGIIPSAQAVLAWTLTPAIAQ